MRYGRDVELTSAMLDDATDGYSPCPEALFQILKTWVSRTDYPGTLFDNCAGDGFAANSLAQAWGLRPVLVEPHRDRHFLCLRYDRASICAPAQHVIGSGPTVWFFNPPFDLADESGSMESHILWAAVNQVPRPQTFCVWLLPQRMMNEPLFAELLVRHLVELRIFNLPSEWEDYRQVAVMGYWGDNGENRAGSHELTSRALLSDSPTLYVSNRPYKLKDVGMNFSAGLRPTHVSERDCRENSQIFAKGVV